MEKVKATLSKLTQESPKTEAILEREARLLRRLERLVDLVFALMIFRVFTMLPKPPRESLKEGLHVIDLLVEYAHTFQVFLIGMVLLILYWAQNNVQLGNLKRTDGKHAVFTLIHLIFLLLYLYFVRLGEDFEQDIDTLALQSVSLALAGLFSLGAWYYASRNRRLISEALSDLEAKERGVEMMIEPFTAVVTIAFAFVGPTAWGLSWLLALPIGWLLKRRLSSHQSAK